LNIVVWVKPNAGQGSFYRSQHEFVVVFRAGEAAALRAPGLSAMGRPTPMLGTSRWRGFSSSNRPL